MSETATNVDNRILLYCERIAKIIASQYDVTDKAAIQVFRDQLLGFVIVMQQVIELELEQEDDPSPSE